MRSATNYGFWWGGNNTLFQSTHSMRSATWPLALWPCTSTINFNPRTPCGVRLPWCGVITVFDLFQSTHSMRSATGNFVVDAPLTTFQSTHSMRSATMTSDLLTTVWTDFNPRTPCGVRHKPVTSLDIQFLAISIHALHAECDCKHRDRW